MQRTRTDQHRQLFAGVENVRSPPEIGLVRHDTRRSVTDTGMHGAMFARWRRHRVHFLHVVWNNDTCDRAFRFGGANGTINQVANCGRARCHVHVLVGDIFE